MAGKGAQEPLAGKGGQESLAGKGGQEPVAGKGGQEPAGQSQLSAGNAQPVSFEKVQSEVVVLSTLMRSQAELTLPDKLECWLESDPSCVRNQLRGGSPSVGAICIDRCAIHQLKMDIDTLDLVSAYSRSPAVAQAQSQQLHSQLWGLGNVQSGDQNDSAVCWPDVLTLSFPELEFYSPVQSPPLCIELSVRFSFFLTNDKSERKQCEYALRAQQPIRVRFEQQQRIADIYRYTSKSSAQQIQGLTLELLSLMKVSLELLAKEEDEQEELKSVCSTKLDILPLVNAKTGVHQSWLSVQSDKLDYKGIVFLRQQSILNSSSSSSPVFNKLAQSGVRAQHGSYFSHFVESQRGNRILALPNGEQLEISNFPSELLGAAYRVMQALDEPIFDQWSLCTYVSKKRVTLETYETINVFLQAITQSALQKFLYQSRLKQQLWVNLFSKQLSQQKLLEKKSLSEQDIQLLQQYKYDLYYMVQQGIPDEQRLTIWLQFGDTEPAARELLNSLLQQKPIKNLNASALSGSQLQLDERTPALSQSQLPSLQRDGLANREEIYLHLKLRGQYSGSQRVAQMMEDFNFMVIQNRGEFFMEREADAAEAPVESTQSYLKQSQPGLSDTHNLSPGTSQVDLDQINNGGLKQEFQLRLQRQLEKQEHRQKLTSVLQTLLFACSLTEDMQSFVFDKSLIHVLMKLSLNANLRAEHDLFWVMMTLCRRCLALYHTDDAQLKADLFALNYVFRTRRDLAPIYDKLDRLSLSLEQLFGDCYLSLFSGVLNSEMFFRILDLAFLEMSRKKFSLGCLLNGVVVTVLKNLQQQISQSFYGSEVPFLIRHYCRFNMKYDFFILQLLENIDAYFYDAQEEKYQVPGLEQEYARFELAQNQFFQAVNDQNHFFYDLIDEKLIQPPKIDQLQNFYNAVDKSLSNLSVETLALQKSLPKQFFESLQKPALHSLHLNIYSINLDLKFYNFRIATTFLGETQLAQTQVAKRMDIYQSFYVDSQQLQTSAPAHFSQEADYVLVEVTEDRELNASQLSASHLNASQLNYSQTAGPLSAEKGAPGNASATRKVQFRLSGLISLRALAFDTVHKRTVSLYVVDIENDSFIRGVIVHRPVVAQMDVCLLLNSYPGINQVNAGRYSTQFHKMTGSSPHQIRHRKSFQYFDAAAINNDPDPYKLDLSFGRYFPFKLEQNFVNQVCAVPRLAHVSHAFSAHNIFTEWKVNSVQSFSLFQQILPCLLTQLSPQKTQSLFQLFAAQDGHFFLLDLILVLTVLSDGTFAQKVELIFHFLLLYDQKASNGQGKVSSRIVVSFLISLYQRLKLYYPESSICVSEMLIHTNALPEIHKAVLHPTNAALDPIYVTDFVRHEFAYETFKRNLQRNLQLSDEQFLAQLSSYIKKRFGRECVPCTLRVKTSTQNIIREHSIELQVKNGSFTPQLQITSSLFKKSNNYQLQNLLTEDRDLVTLWEDTMYSMEDFKMLMYKMPLASYILTVYSQADPAREALKRQKMLQIQLAVLIEGEAKATYKVIDQKYEFVSDKLNLDKACEVLFVNELNQFTSLDDIILQVTPMVEQKNSLELCSHDYKLTYTNFLGGQQKLKKSDTLAKKKILRYNDVYDFSVNYYAKLPQTSAGQPQKQPEPTEQKESLQPESGDNANEAHTASDTGVYLSPVSFYNTNYLRYFPFQLVDKINSIKLKNFVLLKTSQLLEGIYFLCESSSTIRLLD